MSLTRAVASWLLLHGLAHAAQTKSVAPLSISPSKYWDGIDGWWSTFNIALGTPAQSVRLLPGTSNNQIWTILPAGCAEDNANLTLSACDITRGNTFHRFHSSTWSTQELATNKSITLIAPEEIALGLQHAGNYGFDAVTLGLLGSGSPALQNQTIAGIWTVDFWLGNLGLSADPLYITSSVDAVASVLGTLHNLSLVPSMSWGYTAGAFYRNAAAFGSLTLGGYDSSRFTRNDASFDLRNSTSRDLLLTLDSISHNATDSQPLLLGAPIDVFIDSLVTELYLPVTVCQAFETAFGLQWDSTTERYLINETTHNNLLVQNPTFNMTFSQPGNGTATILLPYAAFDLNATQPLVNTTSRYFPLKQAQNSTQYTLGRTFLQEAYIITDYERRNFSVYQAVSDGSPAQLVAINSPEPQAAKHRSGLTGGAIAGIVIAIIVALALVVGAVFWFRRQWRLAIGDTIDEKHAETEQSSPVSRYEVDGGTGRHELSVQEQRKAELDGSRQIKDRPLPAIKVHEMRANETPAIDLEAVVR
ncbi:hypothetical protein LTR17_019003 [Elasticomyces elasticus]|nr:hypothetical protein LTR17_019003 [Elasticomyces elasticus]